MGGWIPGFVIDRGRNQKMAEGIKEVSPGGLAKVKRHSFFVDLLIRLVREKPLGTVGAAIVLLLLLAGIFANWIAPYGYNEVWVGPKAGPATTQFWLGTDNVGRDLLSRIIYGARISMFVGLGVSSIGIILNAIIGLISGYVGGITDMIIQRFVDAWMCFPGIFIILTIMGLLGPGVLQMILVLGVLYGITGSRTIRSAVISVKENIYVEAGRAIGCPTWKILLRHILPNIMAPLIIVFTVSIGSAILIESSISFLGYGIPPPIPSWGGMISQARLDMLSAPWLIFWPGLALVIVVYGINMFGDALRDLLDPRLRGGLGRYSGTKKKIPKQKAAKK
jgi:peptide/nickel transport system permease protein